MRHDIKIWSVRIWFKYCYYIFQTVEKPPEKEVGGYKLTPRTSIANFTNAERKLKKTPRIEVLLVHFRHINCIIRHRWSKFHMLITGYCAITSTKPVLLFLLLNFLNHFIYIEYQIQELNTAWITKYYSLYTKCETINLASISY